LLSPLVLLSFGLDSCRPLSSCQDLQDLLPLLYTTSPTNSRQSLFRPTLLIIEVCTRLYSFLGVGISWNFPYGASLANAKPVFFFPPLSRIQHLSAQPFFRYVLFNPFRRFAPLFHLVPALLVPPAPPPTHRFR